MVDYRLELVGMPVSDVDRAKEFYGTTLGWSVDHDHKVSDEVRFVQVTPPARRARSPSARASATWRPVR